MFSRAVLCSKIILMLKKYFFLFSFLVAAQVVFSQNPNATQPGNQPISPKGTAKISGAVVDSISGEAVGYATITLLSLPKNQAVDGDMTDEKGSFSLQNLSAGKYRLVVSFLGFRSKTIDNVEVTDGQNLKFGKIQLASQTKILAEATIVGTTELIEEKVDRTVYNAEKDVTARGGDAADVLRRVPMLSVDFDGNVSLRGNSNIKVLINNKPSTILASNVADALKQLPADMIKSVEVITSPSARYDAEGSGGIINIITKKNNIEGFFLNVDAGAGNRSSNLGLNGSYRRGKFGATVGGHGRGMYNRSVSIFDAKTVVGGIAKITDQNVEARDRGLFGHYNFGFDYDISEKQSLTAGARFGTRNFWKMQEQTTLLFEDNILKTNTLRDVDNRDLSNSIDLNLDYLRTFKPQQELSFSTQFSRSGLTNNYDANLFDAASDPIFLQKNLNFNTNRELTFQSDYSTPIAKNHLIEFGGKGIFRAVNSDYEFQSSASPGEPFLIDKSQPSGGLDYSQNVGAGYISYTFTTKNKYAFKVGSRYEYTQITAKTEENPVRPGHPGGGDFEVPDYGNLVPSVNISKTLKNKLTIKTGYNRRIQRPGLQQLNPNFNTTNTQNITVGNPGLRPELTDNFELGFSKQVQKTNLNISFFGRETNNAISQVRQPSDTLAGAIVTTFQNVGRQRAVGTNVFANAQITKSWSINTGFDLIFAKLEGQVPGENGTSVAASNSGFTLGGRFMSQVRLGKGWSLQGFGFMRGRQVVLQGVQGSFGGYSLGLKRDFQEGKGSLGFAVDNFLTARTTIMKTRLEAANFYQNSETQMINRGVKLTVNYRFGKVGFEEKKKKTRSVKNDDIKDGEGGGQGGGMENQGNQGGGNRPSGVPPGGKPTGKPGEKPAGTPPGSEKKKEN